MTLDPGTRFIIVTIDRDGDIRVDASGVDSWAAHSILSAAADQIWEEHPYMTITNVGQT